ncbi:YciI family protein [Luteipulveratus halotolerans]|uniref:YCII-related domain-containing protein n=1 Tax=Luteipulveratus halotolerans TaxID=1631356 RepID=A0A0L6CMM4_9MICO|nr:YciI family protein [Luteipulveratus halotolerans]KNX38974.1 hypothetical protein VV01_20525 [Luteipulveratus halotolerans]
MTQYLLSVMAREGGPKMSPEEQEKSWYDTGTFNDSLRERGAWVFAGGLGGTPSVIDARGSKAVTTDGPFSESKEYTAGLWIIEAPDLAAAQAIAAEGSHACGAVVEVRPFMTLDEARAANGIEE